MDLSNIMENQLSIEQQTNLQSRILESMFELEFTLEDLRLQHASEEAISQFHEGFIGGLCGYYDYETLMTSSNPNTIRSSYTEETSDNDKPKDGSKKDEDSKSDTNNDSNTSKKQPPSSLMSKLKSIANRAWEFIKSQWRKFIEFIRKAITFLLKKITSTSSTLKNNSSSDNNSSSSSSKQVTFTVYNIPEVMRSIPRPVINSKDQDEFKRRYYEHDPEHYQYSETLDISKAEHYIKRLLDEADCLIQEMKKLLADAEKYEKEVLATLQDKSFQAERAYIARKLDMDGKFKKSQQQYDKLAPKVKAAEDRYLASKEKSASNFMNKPFEWMAKSKYSKVKQEYNNAAYDYNYQREIIERARVTYERQKQIFESAKEYVKASKTYCEFCMKVAGQNIVTCQEILKKIRSASSDTNNSTSSKSTNESTSLLSPFVQDYISSVKLIIESYSITVKEARSEYESIMESYDSTVSLMEAAL